ncbi:hypothetical protein UPYG_G00181280 [Umbra pygmaea]|uniref:SH3 domain-containing protein n=1 Tax=Umbra pygmaea TaxID=75934 RepID=A0ABD0X7F5_UMBPY
MQRATVALCYKQSVYRPRQGQTWTHREKTSVRALMAQFNTGRGGPKVGGGPTKLATQSRTQPRSPLLAKMAALENIEQSRTTTGSPAPRPVFQNKVDMASREDLGTPFPKPSTLKPSSVETSGNPELSGSEPSYAKPVMKKTPVNAAFLNKTMPPPTLGSTKPPWVKNVGSENTPNIPQPPSNPTPKISNKPLQSHTDQGTSKEPTEPTNPKLTSSFLFKSPPPLAQQNTLSRQGSEKENVGAVKASLQRLNSDKRIPPKPSSLQKSLFLTDESGATELLVADKQNDDPSAPKRKQLPNIFASGKPPVKPNRPPHVDLHQFRMDDPGVRTPSHPLSPTIPKTFPCLPPPSADIMSRGQADLESYDDVGIRNLPPPLPSGGHPNQKTEVKRSLETAEAELISEETYEDLDERWTEKEVKKTKTSEKNTKEKNKPVKEESSDEEMYEDLDKRWSEHEATGSKETKENEKKSEKEKSDKEEKKRLEQEKKLQKAREKREQEARKKYKLSDQSQVIHTAKSRLDCKGGKSDLPLKQGEMIDIIRITDNPDGRWLARNTEGVYGYVKTESVEIDYGLLKQKSKAHLSSQSVDEPEVYDDVAIQDNACSGIKEQAKDHELYDDVDAANPKRFSTPHAGGDDVYDDVDSQVFPTPPPLDSIPQLTRKGKQGEMDPKKKKKLEKEEKEFRKRFKFEGEIQVLYEVTIDPSLASKKWGNKDLQLKPGEVIEVIVKPTDGKLIGRNRDGKFGYVSMINVTNDAGDIYDDIGEDCIYDND